MKLPTLALKLLVAVACLLLGGCTTLLGEFSIDTNQGPNGGGSGNNPIGMQGDIVIMPTKGLITSEQGGKATFSVVLKRKPMAPVAISLKSSNALEGTVSPGVLTFTEWNFNAPQIAQITGVDDDQPDGPQTYTIQTSPAESNDGTYSGFKPIDPEVTNIDDDTAGFTLMPTEGLTTTESGGEAKFTIQLNHAPTADVSITLTSDKPNEGAVSPAMLTFTSVNWMAPQIVTVTGVNDDAKDGAQIFHVVTGNAMSADTNYNGLDVPDEEVTNLDNDTAGVLLNPAKGLLTYENGPMASLTIALASPPSSNVTISLESDDTSEGVVSPTDVTFTPLNWMAPQIISVTGADDAAADGNQIYHVVPKITGSDDPDYAVLSPPNAEVTNIDDDSASFTVMPTAGLMTGEDLSSATFTVVLNSRPKGDVLFDVVSSRPEEGVATPNALRFTEVNWNAPQVVTVMGVNDDVADGSQAYVVRVKPRPSPDTADGDYALLIEQDVSLVNVDDDQPGVTVTPLNGLTTTESGGTATFTVRLNSQPKAEVTIGLSSSNGAEGTAWPDSLKFTAENWKAPQTVTVRGANDSMADGNQPYRIITQNAVSGDAGYNGLDVPNVEVVNIDDDSPGIRVSPTNTTLFTNESGGTATFTVVLNSQPSANVSFNLTSSNTGEGTVSPGGLTFTKDNWNAPQTVTVKGANDDSYDGAQRYRVQFSTIMSADGNYAGDRVKPLDVNCVNIDNDSAGITLKNATNLKTTERNAGTATFQVVLDSKPTAPVTIGISSSRTSEGTVSPMSLVFTQANWAALQTVTLTGVDDKFADGSQQYFVIFAPAQSQDQNYAGKVPPNGNVTVTNVDDDSPGVIVTAAPGIATSEQKTSATATFTVQLQSQPTSDVTIPLTSSRPTEGTVSPISLTFTGQNWSAPRTVTLTGVNDDIQDGDQPYSITFGPVSSTDPNYNRINVPDLAVVNKGNDTAGIVVSAISGDTTEKGGTATFTVALLTQPTADVVVNLDSSNKMEGVASPAQLTFTGVNWASPQTVTVTGVDDKIQDGNQPYTIDLAPAKSKDGNYQDKDPADVSVINKDDDTAGITVSKISGNTSEDGRSATFTVVLDTRPSATVTLTLLSNDESEGTISDSMLMFSTVDWGSPKTVTVTGADDQSADRDQPYSIVFGAAKSADKNYDGKQPASVSVVNLDNDTAGIVVSADKGTTSEDGDSFTFTVNLTSQPSANVVIPISSSDVEEGTVNVPSLKFTTTNWASKQSVTVTGVNDQQIDGSASYTVVIGSPDTTDATYAEIDPLDVAMVNIDNDSAGFIVTPASGHTTEGGGTTTFTVKLRSKPSADVTISLKSSDSGEGTLTVKNVVLTPSDWDTAHQVTIHGEDDDAEDGPQPYSIITGDAESADLNYNGHAVPDVDVINDDNDTAGYTVSPASGHTNEGGGSATFTIVLNSEPTDDVVIPISTSNAQEGKATATSVKFTMANWKTAQTVTVNGVDDSVADGSVEYQIQLGKPTTNDANYAALDPPDVTLTNDDNDSAAFSIDPPDMNVTGESASAAVVTFKVALTSKPKSPVVIPLSSSNETEGVIASPMNATLTFTAANWSTAQSVTVQGVDDEVVDGDQMYTIQLGPPQTMDPEYAALGPQKLNLINADDDAAAQ